jgi:hypothetical protein
VVVALLGGGHALLEDVPGVGKSLLAKSSARSVDSRFQRLQCSPDLLPTEHYTLQAQIFGILKAVNLALCRGQYLLTSY